MQLPSRSATAYMAGFVIFLIVFAYAILTYSRRVDGVSMFPTLEEGDLVGIQQVSLSDVHVGDIIVYNPPCSVTGNSVIHRVVNITQEGLLITKGDDQRTNPNTDQVLGIATSPITQQCLVAKVVFVIPYIEKLASLPYGLNYFIAFLIFLAIIYTELEGRSRPPPENEHNPALP